MNTENISYVLSSISIFFYSIVYVPQFIIMYKTNSSDGLSIWTILSWTQADVLSLMSSILLHMPLSITLIGWYHYFIGILMTIAVLYFNPNNTFNIYFATSLFLIINTLVTIILQIVIDKSYDSIGLTMSWIIMPIYIIGRFPQIFLNYKRKNTKGLSLLMYIFTILGNSFYLSVITFDPIYINSNIPWIISSVINIILDFIVVFQKYYYKYLYRITHLIHEHDIIQHEHDIIQREHDILEHEH